MKTGKHSTPFFFAPLVIVVTACALALLPACRAQAWTDATHERIARELLPLLPPELEKLCGREIEAYLEGVADEPELFDRATDEKKGTPSPAEVQQRGMELFFLQVQRIVFFLEKKSGDHAIAYDMGKTARLAADIMEPMPGGNEFRPLEIAGNRMFFLDDVERALEKYRYVYVSRQAIRSFPERISAELEIAGKKGEIIYKAYRDGRGYSDIENDAHVMVNRTLNLLADSFHTLYYKPFSAQQSPFNPTQELGLDRFRKKSSSGSGMSVKPPDPPAPPVAPEKLEIDDKEKSENKTAGEGN